MTRDKEIWAVALWVEKHQGDQGWFYIAQQQDRLLTECEFDGVVMWRTVGEQLEAMHTAGATSPPS